MSKSDENGKGTIYILDDINVSKKKIKSAVTDSDGHIHYDPENKPGISNLLEIYSILSNRSIEDIEKQYDGKGYGEFKKEVGECVYQFLTQLQSKYKEIIASGMVEKVITEGNDKARQIAHKKIMKVKKVMAMAMASAMILSLTACGGGNSSDDAAKGGETQSEEKVTVNVVEPNKDAANTEKTDETLTVGLASEPSSLYGASVGKTENEEQIIGNAMLDSLVKFNYSTNEIEPILQRNGNGLMTHI